MGKVFILFFAATLLISTKAASQLHLKALPDSMKPGLSIRVLPQNFYNQHLSFTCKKEVQLQKLTTLPLYIRLGSKEAVDYLEGIGRLEIFKHDVDLTHYALERMKEVPGLRVLGTANEHAGAISFVMDAAHPHDLTTFADRYGLAMRGGHHCNQPLMRRFGVPGSTRASFYLYNTREEIDRMIEILQKAVKFFK